MLFSCLRPVTHFSRTVRVKRRSLWLLHNKRQPVLSVQYWAAGKAYRWGWYQLKEIKLCCISRPRLPVNPLSHLMVHEQHAIVPSHFSCFQISFNPVCIKHFLCCFRWEWQLCGFGILFENWPVLMNVHTTTWRDLVCSTELPPNQKLHLAANHEVSSCFYSIKKEIKWTQT